MIKKILVALDGSESADKALDFALDLAGKCSAEILLLSVVPPVIVPPYVYPSFGATPVPSPPSEFQTYSDKLKGRFEKVLRGALKKTRETNPDLKVSTKLEDGHVAEKIIKTAEEENVDLIVMGSRGLSGIKELFLGSNSDTVVHKATCPVLIVK